MNNIPKTMKVTLKQIVENMDQMPDTFGQQPKKLSQEQKMKLQEMASMFEKFGECLQNEEALMYSAKGITELCELAETYALTECGDWFQQNIVERDMKELKKRTVEFGKITKEAYARMQQLGVAYQDIGHVLGRYYDLKGAKGTDQKLDQTSGKQPLQETDLSTDKTTQRGAKMAKPMLAKIDIKKK